MYTPDEEIEQGPVDLYYSTLLLTESLTHVCMHLDNHIAPFKACHPLAANQAWANVKGRPSDDRAWPGRTVRDGAEASGATGEDGFN